MKGYKHLSLEEREILYSLKAQNLCLRGIAETLNRSHATISRELRRNRRYLEPYIPCHAQRYAERRLHQQRAEAPLKNPVIYEYVQKHLKLRWSPETIAGRLPLDHPGVHITHETIYRYIYREAKKGWYLWKYLPLARKKRMKKMGRRVRRGRTIPDGVCIDERPQEANARTVPGHWETDNVIGKVTDTSALSTTVERVSRYVLLTKLKNKSAEAKQAALVGRLKYFPSQIRKTMTTDNGTENSYHREITRVLSLPMYFCHAYHSWEKGTVENTNGRIRRYIPKHKSIDLLSDKDIALIEYRLNTTPRKCLGFATPEEIMRQAVTASEYDKLKRMMQEQQKREQPEEHIALLQKQDACGCGYCTLEEVEEVEKTFYHLL